MTGPNQQLVEAVAAAEALMPNGVLRNDRQQMWNAVFAGLEAAQVTEGECQKLRSANARLVHTLTRCRHLPQKGSVLADEIDAALKEQSK